MDVDADVDVDRISSRPLLCTAAATRRLGFLCLFVALFAALLAAPSAAIADSKRLRRAKERFEQAETAYRSGRFADALTHYQATLELARSLAIIFNIAQCHRQLGDHEKALFFYKLYLSDWQRENPNVESPIHEEVTEHIRRLSARLAADKKHEQQRQQPRETRDAAPAASADQRRSTRGRIRLYGLRVARAWVFVDGVPRATAPAKEPIDVPSGKHRVRVEADGYQRWTRELDVPAGGEASAVVALQHLAGRSKFWLVSTLSSAALAGGAVALGIAFAGEADEHFRDTPPFDADYGVMVTGYVLAGAFAAWAATSLVFYLRSGASREPADAPGSGSAGVLPVAGGALFTARGVF